MLNTTYKTVYLIFNSILNTEQGVVYTEYVYLIGSAEATLLNTAGEQTRTTTFNHSGC